MHHVFVISAPSGAGKTTVINEVLKRDSEIKLMVSVTTRSPRPNEIDNIDYKFVDKKAFDDLRKKKLLVEWAEVHGQFYGTQKKEIDGCLKSGKDALLDVDTQGADSVRKKYSDAVSIFLLPPSFEELVCRLEGRGTNTKKDIATRVANAKGEMQRRHEYDHQVVNEDLEEAIEEILDIIDYHRTQNEA